MIVLFELVCDTIRLQISESLLPANQLPFIQRFTPIQPIVVDYAVLASAIGICI